MDTPTLDPTLPAAVRFDGVGRTFGQTIALDDVNLDIPTGQTVALLGPERRRQVDRDRLCSACSSRLRRGPRSSA